MALRTHSHVIVLLVLISLLTVNPSSIGGNTEIVFEKSINIATQISTPEHILDWTSNDDSTLDSVSNNDTIIGDHVILHSTPTAPDGRTIDNISLTIPQQLFYNSTHDLVVPDPDFHPFDFQFSIFDSNFYWIIISNISIGSTIQLKATFSNNDTDVMAWHGNQNQEGYSYNNNVVGDSMATSQNPEIGEIEWFYPNNTMIVAVYDFAEEGGNFTLEITSIKEELASGIDTLEYDTYTFEINRTTDFQISFTLDNGSQYLYEFLNVTIQNFFVPKISDIQITNEDAVFTFSWTIEDRNQLENHSSDIFLASDGGTTYLRIGSNLNETTFEFNMTGFINREYHIRITVTDPFGLIGVAAEEFSLTPPVNPMLLGIEPAENRVIEFGSSGNEIIWNLIVEGSPICGYRISVDSIQVIESTSSDGIIQFNLDNLPIGTHSVNLEVWLGGIQYSDSVTIIVVESGIPLWVYLSVGLTIVGIAITGVFLYKIAEAKKKRIGKWNPEDILT